jgi:hypothetical protein
MANKRLIKFYKGYLLENIYKAVRNDLNIEKNDLNVWIKTKILNSDISCNEMTNDQLYEIIYFCFNFGDKLDIYLNFPDNEFTTD